MSTPIRQSPHSALLTRVGDWVDRICRREMPRVHSAFVFSGLPVGVVAQLWLEQCFLNYLPVEAIYKFILALIVLGPEIAVYFTCAVIKDRAASCIDAQIDQDLARMLKHSQQQQFELAPHVPYMRQLQKMYQVEF